jgi:cyclic pyranopterin phosphate synthase
MQNGSNLMTPKARYDEYSSSMLYDPFGRKLNSLRISITQKCNLHCFFCHKEGETASNNEMTPEEIGKIAKIASELGMKKIKLTGGEPLLREDLPKIVHEIAQYADEVSLTTNGVLLEKYAQTLHDAGLKRVNVSLCSISPENFRKITQKAHLEQVKNGIKAALQSGLYPVKINMVMLRDINVDEIPQAIDFAQETNAILQLIEFQPIQRENIAYWKDFHYDLAPVEELLKEKAVSIEENPLHKRKRYLLKRNGDSALVEIVRPMHNSGFCQNCTRLRVTSDGKLKPCLLRNDNLIDIISLIRHGAESKELKEAFKKAVLLREPYWREENENFCEETRNIASNVKNGKRI